MTRRPTYLFLILALTTLWACKGGDPFEEVFGSQSADPDEDAGAGGATADGSNGTDAEPNGSSPADGNLATGDAGHDAGADGDDDASVETSGDAGAAHDGGALAVSQ